MTLPGMWRRAPLRPHKAASGLIGRLKGLGKGSVDMGSGVGRRRL